MPNNERPLDRFLATVAEIEMTLQALKEANDDHYDLSPDEVLWANVGDAKRTLAGLKEVLAIIRGENR